MSADPHALTQPSAGSFFELVLLVAEAAVEPVSEALDALDALSVSVEDADALTPAEQALARMRTALAETVVEGIHTNIPLHRELMVDASFVAGGTNIHYLEEWLSQRSR